MCFFFKTWGIQKAWGKIWNKNNGKLHLDVPLEVRIKGWQMDDNLHTNGVY